MPSRASRPYAVTEPLPTDASAYLRGIREEIPRYDELQRQTVEAIPLRPETVLELGIGTGETTRRLLKAHPEARVTGLDASPDMAFAAREVAHEVRLARMQDPLPDGPWDLVVSVLSIHLLDAEEKRALFRRVGEQARALVLGDVVRHDPQIAPVHPGVDFLATAEELAEWCGGQVTWRSDDLAVISASYDR